MLQGIINRLLRTVRILEQEIKDNREKPIAEQAGEDWENERLDVIGEIYSTLRSLGWEPTE